FFWRKMMILELNHTEFYKCRNLLAEPGQIEAKAIIEGMNPGRIWVDNIDNPTTGFIWLGNHDGFIFIGNEENNRFNTEINYLIDKVIIPEAKKVGLTWFEAIGNHQKWDQTLKKIFEHRKLGNWNQRVY